MQHTVIFKGKYSDDVYHWQNVADAPPKQLYSIKCDITSKAYPKVNQQYIVRYERLEGANMRNLYEIIEHYATCSYWKSVGSELVFKKGKNAGLTVTQYASCFPNNHEEEKSFLKSITALYRKTNNAYTRNNIIRVLNSGVIKYCEVFGYEGCVIQLGSYKGVDMTTVTSHNYLQVRNRLEYFAKTIINPLTVSNCLNWIKYLDTKFIR